jgi:glutamate synthase domain-containing protein 3
LLTVGEPSLKTNPCIAVTESSIVATTLRFDLSSEQSAHVRHQLRALDRQQEYEIEVVCSGTPCYVLNGYRIHGQVKVKGSVGDFCLLSFGDSEGIVEGDAGDFFAHSIHSGVLLLQGNAGVGVAALGHGGLVSVYGNAGDRVALGMQGADIVVRGNVGDQCGLGMQDGSIVILGNAGEELGKGMRGGTIYLRGEAKSISADIEEARLREPDKLKIGLLLLKAGIKATGKDFKVFRPAN